MKDKTPIHPTYLGWQLEATSKVCSGCNVDKPLEDYYGHKKGKFGKRSKCKACFKELVSAWKVNNKDKTKKATKEWRQRNRDVYNSTHANWCSNNRDKRNYKEGLRRAAKSSATPPWLTDEQKDEILYRYSLAKEVEILTGDKYHVDHIVPLVNDVICGLHVPWNLQVLPSDLNLKKHNTFVQEYT